MSAYDQTNEPATWTRIDMLLTLYSSAIDQVKLAIESLTAGQAGQAAIHRTRGAAIVTAIRSGIDPLHGELPGKVDQLCEFVQFTLAEGDIKNLNSSLKVLSELHEGFSGVRGDALQMERRGEIPRLPTESALELHC